MVADDEWLTAVEAARLLGVGERTVYGLIDTGKLEAMQWPVRIRRSALDACVSACRIKPGELAQLNQYAAGTYRYSPRLRGQRTQAAEG